MAEIDLRPTNGTVATPGRLDTFDATRTTTRIREQAGWLRNRALTVTGDIVDIHDRAVETEIDARAASLARQDAVEILDSLNERGFAWRDVARMVGVSVPALQKWRRGQSITGANRLQLARIAAVVALVEDALISDPASWLETPVKAGVSVTPLDLVADGWEKLAVQFANDHCTPTDLLDEFDADWRQTRVDEGFETYLDEEGIRSIRPKR